MIDMTYPGVVPMHKVAIPIFLQENIVLLFLYATSGFVVASLKLLLDVGQFWREDRIWYDSELQGAPGGF